MSNRKKLLVAALAVAFTPLSAAVDYQDGASHRWGAFRVKPVIDLKLLTTDNLYRSNARETRDTAMVISPSVELTTGTQNVSYALGLELETAKYKRNDDDDYTDFSISNTIQLTTSTKGSFVINLDYEAGHEDRGTGRTEVQLLDPVQDADEYSIKTAGIIYRYGLPGSKASIELGHEYQAYKPTNNRALTRAREHDSHLSHAVLRYKVAPKTTLLAETRYRRTEYDQNAGAIGDVVSFTAGNNGAYDLDSRETSYFIGAEWDATAKTTGTIRVGRLNKSFDEDTVNAISGDDGDVSTNVWELGVNWHPKSYSVVDITSGRSTGESAGFGLSQVNSYLNASWNHNWSSRLSTDAGLGYSKVDFSGTTREDKLVVSGLSANYKVRRWFSVSAGMDRTKNESSDAIYDYTRNDVYLSAELKL